MHFTFDPRKDAANIVKHGPARRRAKRNNHYQ
jgi:uncharacterized DUF497 family protein